MEPQIEKRANFLIENNNHVIKEFYREALKKCGFKIEVENNLNEEINIDNIRSKCKHIECAKNKNGRFPFHHTFFIPHRINDFFPFHPVE